MIIGTFYMSMPLTMVGAQYSACYEEKKERARQEQNRETGRPDNLRLDSEDKELVDAYRNKKKEMIRLVQAIKGEGNGCSDGQGNMSASSHNSLS